MNDPSQAAPFFRRAWRSNQSPPVLRLPEDALATRPGENWQSLRPEFRLDIGMPETDRAGLVHPAQVPEDFRRPSKSFQLSRDNQDARLKPWPACFCPSRSGPSMRVLRHAEHAM